MVSDKRKTAEIVLEKIVGNFLKNHLETGDKLPSERELARLLVSAETQFEKHYKF